MRFCDGPGARGLAQGLLGAFDAVTCRATESHPIAELSTGAHHEAVCWWL